MSIQTIHSKHHQSKEQCNKSVFCKMDKYMVNHN
jgi:hypothetical protein